MMHGQTIISGNEIYMLIKYIKSVLWRVAKRLSYIEEARCLKVNFGFEFNNGKYCIEHDQTIVI